MDFLVLESLPVQLNMERSQISDKVDEALTQPLTEICLMITAILLLVQNQKYVEYQQGVK